MDSHTGPLLLLVQANIAPEHEEALNRWYYHHVPRLLEISTVSKTWTRWCVLWPPTRR